MTTGFNAPQQFAQNQALASQSPASATPQEATPEHIAEDAPEGVSPAASPSVDFNALPPEELNRMYQFYQQAQVDRELQQLRSAWGEDYENNYQEVSQFFTTVPEPYQGAAASLNNAWGAQIIAKALAYDKLLTQQQQVVPGAVPPRFDQPSPISGANSKFKFTRSQIRSMSAEEYNAKKGEIAAAYAEGTVYNDV